MNPTTHQERKDLRKLHEAQRRAVTAQHRPTKRQNHTRALQAVLAANAEGVEVAELLAMGRRAGLRDRHIRRAIAGKEAHGRVAHPFPQRFNHRRRQRLGRSMTTIMTLVAKAVDAGWEPGDPSPLTPEETQQLREARKKVVIPSVNLTQPKMYRDPAWAERLRDRAGMRRHIRDIKRRMTAPPDQLYVNFKPRDPLTGVKKIVVTAPDPDPFGLAVHDEVTVDATEATRIMDEMAAQKFDAPRPCGKCKKPMANWEELLDLAAEMEWSGPVLCEDCRFASDAPRWLTAAEAADTLGVTASTIRRWAKAGKFEETRNEGQLQITAYSVDQVRTRRLTERS